MHPPKKAQIAYLKANETFTKVSSKYIYFADVFLPKLATKLFEYMKIDDHATKLVDNWQLAYGLIYSLGLIKLEILKAYNENNLINSFIKPSKSFAEVSILFDQKSNSSLRLCVINQGFNNLTIKNRYLLPLVKELLD